MSDIVINKEGSENTKGDTIYVGSSAVDDKISIIVDKDLTAAKESAVASALLASEKAEEASTSADNAKASELSASTSASTATTQAGIATTKATEASASEANALTSASIANTKANEASASATTATTQAGIATTKASEASSSASSASTSAATATTQAGIATTQATSASASASAASTSYTNASNSEAQALTYSQDAGVFATSASNSKDAAATSATDASNSAGVASLNATSASNSASVATTKASEASTSATNAEASNQSAIASANSAQLNATSASSSASSSYTYSQNSEASSLLAEKWAEEATDIEVTTGKYSAKHWAEKAQQSATGSLVYKGVWDATTAFPSSPALGEYYKVSVAGAEATAPYTYNVGDAIIYNGTSWDLVDNSDIITSVDGQIGTVDLSGNYEPKNSNIQTHISSTANPHSVTKAQVGLGNVDNTSDVNKPISTATQTALNGKVDKNTAITGATKTKITYDSKGLVTGGADLLAADIPTLTASKISDFDTEVANNTAVAANTAKVSNVTTNLSTTYTTTSATVVSSDGTNATIAEASGTQAGVMSVAHHNKLDGIEANANAYVLPVASTSIGGVKSGADITVDASGNVSVNDDSHNHTIANVDGLQTALDGKLSVTGKSADADKLDGIDSSQFLRSDVADTLTVPLKITSNGATLDMGSLNSSWCHFNTTATSGFYFYDNISVAGGTSLTSSSVTTTTFNGALNGNAATATTATNSLDSDKLNGAVEATAGTANTIAKRNADGDVTARLFRSTYGVTTTAPATSAEIVFRNNSTDNYHRTMSSSAFKTWADSVGVSVDGHTHSYLPLTGGTLTGALAANAGITQDGFTVLNGSDTWLRTNGATGWYSATYDGGIYMIDTTYVRTYNNKAFYVGSTATTSINTAGGITMAGDCYVNGGDIVLGGTGRIQGIDTVSSDTDAINRATYATSTTGGTIKARLDGSTLYITTNGTNP